MSDIIKQIQELQRRVLRLEKQKPFRQSIMIYIQKSLTISSVGTTTTIPITVSDSSLANISDWTLSHNRVFFNFTGWVRLSGHYHCILTCVHCFRMYFYNGSTVTQKINHYVGQPAAISGGIAVTLPVYYFYVQPGNYVYFTVEIRSGSTGQIWNGQPLHEWLTFERVY